MPHVENEAITPEIKRKKHYDGDDISIILLYWLAAMRSCRACWYRNMLVTEHGNIDIKKMAPSSLASSPIAIHNQACGREHCSRRIIAIACQMTLFIDIRDARRHEGAACSACLKRASFQANHIYFTMRDISPPGSAGVYADDVFYIAFAKSNNIFRRNNDIHFAGKYAVALKSHHSPVSLFRHRWRGISMQTRPLTVASATWWLAWCFMRLMAFAASMRCQASKSATRVSMRMHFIISVWLLTQIMSAASHRYFALRYAMAISLRFSLAFEKSISNTLGLNTEVLQNGLLTFSFTVHANQYMIVKPKTFLPRTRLIMGWAILMALKCLYAGYDALKAVRIMNSCSPAHAFIMRFRHIMKLLI